MDTICDLTVVWYNPYRGIDFCARVRYKTQVGRTNRSRNPEFSPQIRKCNKPLQRAKATEKGSPARDSTKASAPLRTIQPPLDTDRWGPHNINHCTCTTSNDKSKSRAHICLSGLGTKA
ncbi:hypothetical protein KIN20_030323 [Parelaphostrongylus tenuis]|uniref:Uncharacterized protein n=1 Tax=Parelaphostrongylus tenuis TaxID=148309 RepID=A0AAD5R3N8_PARTN|nr:hypothetical protein KIN20_030323 [Parelaphostrongylus tenuis]